MGSRFRASGYGSKASDAAPAYMLATWDWGWVERGQVASCLVFAYLFLSKMV